MLCNWRVQSWSLLVGRNSRGQTTVLQFAYFQLRQRLPEHQLQCDVLRARSKAPRGSQADHPAARGYPTFQRPCSGAPTVLLDLAIVVFVWDAPTIWLEPTKTYGRIVQNWTCLYQFVLHNISSLDTTWWQSLSMWCQSLPIMGHGEWAINCGTVGKFRMSVIRVKSKLQLIQNCAYAERCSPARLHPTAGRHPASEQLQHPAHPHPVRRSRSASTGDCRSLN